MQGLKERDANSVVTTLPAFHQKFHLVIQYKQTKIEGSSKTRGLLYIAAV